MYILLALVLLLWVAAGLLWLADTSTTMRHVDAILADPESTRRLAKLMDDEMLAA